ncbi:MAG: hypothetical protein DI623_05585 [Sphingomonas sanxanigenens]|uniref:Uncharacterized protein n=1 Tax=Sphingomonas sanxanigenens TaxID=397260 RepID=A0A2W5AC17_9SPHN|nr:MAG: hypothetical protein DI623_05585 [Sphingomonas sanxanigenens]
MESPAVDLNRAGAAEFLVALVRSDGSGAHRFPRMRDLLDGAEGPRNLADAVHYLAALHGRHPGVIDYAANKATHPVARAWLAEAAEGFAIERAAIAQLVAAAGPLPSTPGQAESEAAVSQQRHALEMLAQSDRKGTALGAAFALTLDWSPIRDLLAAASARLGIHLPDNRLPDESSTLAATAAIAETVAVERALAFGAQQILAQHRGLWDLLDARRDARAHI